MLVYNNYYILVKSASKVIIGYIKSIDFENMSFDITMDAEYAKKYENMAMLNKDINRISRFKIAINNNYTFEVK